MPRTLPWLLDRTNEARVKQESTPRKRVKRELDSDTDKTPKRPPSPTEKPDFFRSSQSPPTSPARPCPTEEYLIEGLDHDDAWIMVEDEFYAIAQSFTQHLHYAEYVRRRQEVKAENAAAIGEIERPTDGRTPMPKELQRKKEAEALATRQKAGVGQIAGQEDKEDTDDYDDRWAGTHLYGLMTSPRKVRSLVGVHAVKSSTRAAAGFAQASGSNGSQSQLASTSHSIPPSGAAEAHRIEIDEETLLSEDDDLDGQPYAVTVPQRRLVKSEVPAHKSEIPAAHTVHRQNDGKRVRTLEKGKSLLARSSHKPTNGFKSKVQMLFDDLDELPEQSRSNPSISDKKNGGTTPADQTSGPSTGNNNLETKRSRYKDVPTFLM